MKKPYFLLIIVGVILVAAVILRLTPKKISELPVTPAPVASGTALVGGDRDAHGCIGSAGYSWCAAKQKCLRVWEEACVAALPGEVTVTSPAAGALIASPLKVSGSALGTWFFEASLPLKLVDANDNLITSSPATAQGEWMTTSSVPFTGTLTFTTEATSGFLIVAKDNPSGLPENDAAFPVPVRFK